MPKQRITKEMVVHTAFEIARCRGMEEVMVKTIADEMACSVQPIYSYCKNMAGLRQEVTEQTIRFVQTYIAEHFSEKDPFRSTGRAYIQLAEEEPHLFKIFTLHQRAGIASLDDLYRTQASPQMAALIADTLKISLPQAKQLHLNMLIYTIGIGTILSVTVPGIPTEEIYAQQEAAYKAFLYQALDGGGRVP